MHQLGTIGVVQTPGDLDVLEPVSFILIFKQLDPLEDTITQDPIL